MKNFIAFILVLLSATSAFADHNKSSGSYRASIGSFGIVISDQNYDRRNPSNIGQRIQHQGQTRHSQQYRRPLPEHEQQIILDRDDRRSYYPQERENNYNHSDRQNYRGPQDESLILRTHQGTIVLSFDSCYMRGEYVESYAPAVLHAPNGSKIKGCWHTVNGKYHVFWEHGSISMFNISQFRIE